MVKCFAVGCDDRATMTIIDVRLCRQHFREARGEVINRKWKKKGVLISKEGREYLFRENIRKPAPPQGRWK